MRKEDVEKLAEKLFEASKGNASIYTCERDKKLFVEIINAIFDEVDNRIEAEINTLSQDCHRWYGNNED